MAKRRSKAKRLGGERVATLTTNPIPDDTGITARFDLSKPRSLIITCLLLGFIVALVYSPVLNNEFVKWDDDITLYKNPQVQSLDVDHLSWMFTDVSTMRYKPFAWLTLALIHAISGLDPLSYHFVSLLFHCANTALIFLVLRKLMEMKTEGERDRPIHIFIIAAGAALIWAVHPLRVEVIARVTDMTYCQSLLFVLISLWSYLRAAEIERSDRAGTKRYYWLSVVAFGLAMGTYPFVFAFPAILLLLDYSLLGRFDSPKSPRALSQAKQLWLEKLPFLLLSGILLVTVYGRLNPPEMWKEQALPDQLGWFAKGMQAFYIWSYFVWKPLVPLDLSPVYTTLVSFDPKNWLFVLSALFVIALTVLLFLYRKKWPAIWTIWACHLLLLIPALGLTEHPHYPSDRYSYIQGVLLAAVLAGVLLLICRFPRIFNAVLVLIMMLGVTLAMMSARQIRVWHDSVSLFEYVLSKLGNDPYAADIHGRLGDYYLELKNMDGAVAQYQQIIPFMPDNPNIHNNVGTLLMMSGRFDEASVELKEAVRLDPKAAGLRKNLADVLNRQQRYQEAISELREAIRLAPGDAETHTHLGLVLMKQGEIDNAIYQFQQVVKLQPQDTQARSNLDQALRAKGANSLDSPRQ